MARMPYPDNLSDNPETAAALADFPAVINIVRLTAHAASLTPTLLELAARMMTTLDLSARHRELLVMLVSHETHCDYEWIQHLPQATAAGVGDADLDRLSGKDPSPWPDTADAALIRAGTACLRSTGCDADTMADLVAHFGVRRAIEALYVVGIVRMFTTVINSTDPEIDAAGEQLTSAWRARSRQAAR
ncbi:carboxymuconolactone decarboxylase family protein [Nocardia wallacei]|uniref:carboxymuconolactone decarboxylase family protein n=1 Tax=Nocardia wallacei TaxID=480035 RepID=UPI002456F019|nr:carboxymuconolactone decarboxylase family protein [Nocardia wallacei]